MNQLLSSRSGPDNGVDCWKLAACDYRFDFWGRRRTRFFAELRGGVLPTSARIWRSRERSARLISTISKVTVPGGLSRTRTWACTERIPTVIFSRQDGACGEMPLHGRGAATQIQ